MQANPNATKVRLSDTLFTTIRTSLQTTPGGQQRVVLYTSFGVVRGYVSVDAFDESNRAHDDTLENTSRVIIDPDLIELGQATIEHYSNHLPSASFPRLFVRLSDVQSFAIEESTSTTGR